MYTVEQLIAHAVGDYILQTDQMATKKTDSSRWAAFHAIFYTLPFLFLTQSVIALTIIAGTHFAIDRCVLARYVTKLKTLIDALVLSPRDIRGYFDQMDAAGFPPEVPAYLRVWIFIIADNLLHITINAFAIYYFG